MESLQVKKVDWYFLLLCLGVGILAEEAFFRDQIGISYLVFLAGFYGVFFWRFRGFPFSHQRLGYLLLICIWILAGTYYWNDVMPFYLLNVVVIPSLVITHLALVTAPKPLKWSEMAFVLYILRRLGRGFAYSSKVLVMVARWTKREGANPDQKQVWRKVLLGVAISIPFLFVIVTLLMSADLEFARIVTSFPTLFTFNPEYVFRFVVVFLYTCGFFGYMQILKQRRVDVTTSVSKTVSFDGIVTLTFLSFLNAVYVLFVAVQFTYFFSGGALEDGLTYAEYARRGFFELLFVTLINLSVTLVVIACTKELVGKVKIAIQWALSLVLLSSGVLLVSAFIRMAMYEEAYGFTFLRVLVHSFMMFLMVILAYTMLKIWLEKLSLVHFYVVVSLLYYTGVNVVGLDRMVVDLNMKRYETTGSIDVYYLNSLSATGVLAMLELYEENPDMDGLEDLLRERKVEAMDDDLNGWQSTNRVRDIVSEKMVKWQPKE